jgi:serine/threonine-protein kinase
LSPCVESFIEPLIQKANDKTMGEKTISIKNEIDKNILIKADPIILQSVLEDLISNAIKFSYPGGTILLSSEKKGNIVNIFVSKGIEQIKLTSYIGKGGEQALSELTDAGFDVNVTYQFSENIFKGQVISQSPENSDLIGKGSKIELAVSKGPEFVFVPNILGKTKNDATLDLENLGLRAKTTGSGKVNNISPAIGTKVKQGAIITLTLR